jgi:hypothetical protein
MSDVDVQCEGGRDGGWTCTVAIREDGRVTTTHEVRVRTPDLQRLAPDAVDPTALVRSSFEFLLERESPRSILRSFDLMEIGRYFPEYESDVRRR